MVAIILCLFRFIRLLGSGHQGVAVENLALRLQLAAFRRKRKRPALTQLDRLFWAALSQVWSGWRSALVFVQPDTVVRWQRERFRRFWARLSHPKSGHRGRPGIAAEIRQLVLRMAVCQSALASTENPRRTEDARHHHLRTNRFTDSAVCSTTAFPNLEDVPAKSSRSDRSSRFLHCSDDPAASAIRIPGGRASPPGGASLQRD